MNDILSDTKERMGKSLDALEQNFNVIRTGRANPAILNRVNVDYYGSVTPLPQMATISSPDPRTLVITPFDKSVMDTIEKAIRESDLGFNPNNRGDSIFISIPALNDERRRDLVKTTKTMAEEARVAMRSIRRDANDYLKAMKNDNELSEDELKLGEKKVQELTDDFVKQIDERLKAKEADIMEV